MKKSLLLVSIVLLSQSPLWAEVKTSDERQNDLLGAHSLTLPAPIKRWDNAIPLGNGATGGLLWGQGNKLNLSLDRGDLWDERGNADVYSPKRTFATLLESYQKRDRKTWNRYFNAPYKGSKWTKIPGGRLVISLPAGKESKNFKLDFEAATGRVDFSDGSKADVFFSATEPIALMRLPKGASFELIRPDSINKLGYPAPVFSKSDNEIAYSQQTAEEFSYAFTVQWKDEADACLVAVAMCSSNEAEKPLELARERATSALEKGWLALHKPHLEWWKKLYNASSVTIPEPRLQHHYNLVKYYYGASSRAHASPMPLQGVWTADEGKLPPWKGDYHNDLNTQMTYVAWQAAGLIDPGMSYLNYYWDRLPEFRKYGKEFFGVEGAMVPGVMTHKGQAMGGWPQYSMSLTPGLWNGHAFYQHWKTSGDDTFLAERAYLWLNEVARSVFALCNKVDGKILLPLSSSPEWNNADWSAYLTPNSNNDQALLIWTTLALEEMATALNKPADAQKWAAVRANLAPLKFSKKSKALMVSEGISFNYSHRHFSHCLAIHPLGILNVEQSPQAKEAVQASVRELIDRGSKEWTGYSFTWAASLAARAGFPDDCKRLLIDYERAFVTRNGFHVNGDQTKSGLSKFHYRPFTLEGNFLFMDAIHEMYLQSWGGKIRIFPTVPDSWQEASFRDLRAEGGYKVSATRSKGLTQRVKIEATSDSILSLRDPFAGAKVKWSCPVKREGDWLKVTLRAGESLEGRAIVAGVSE